jgi:hypothetical protein
MHLTRDRDRPAQQQVALVVLVGVLSAVLWFGWFAWDTEYQYSHMTGHMEGPYAVWQGVGALLCGVPVFWLSQRLLLFRVSLWVISGCFTCAWITTAALTDATGLWLVGAIFVGFCSLAGSAVMLGLVTAVDSDLRADDRSASTPT